MKQGDTLGHLRKNHQEYKNCTTVGVNHEDTPTSESNLFVLFLTNRAYFKPKSI